MTDRVISALCPATEADDRGGRPTASAGILVLRLQNQLYRLSSVRNDLHIAEFFEPIFAEFNANP